MIGRKLYEARAKTWKEVTNNKLRAIKEDISPFPEAPNENRREEVVLNRIRAGHTRLTHGHLVETGPPPICPFCNNSILTIKHIFVECNELANQRERHLGERSPQQLENAIGSGANINKIVEFLQNIQLYNQI